MRSALLSILFILAVPSGFLAAADFKDKDFIAGVVLKDAWSPGWGDTYTSSTLEALKKSGAKWAGLHYFWSYSSTATPKIEASYSSEGYASNNAKLIEYERTLNQAKAKGYKTFIIASLYFGNMLGTLDPSQESTLNVSLYDSHSSQWYDNWFSDYMDFLDEMADLAQRTNTDMISIGFHRNYVTEKDRDGYDTTAKWRQLIARVRSRYSGKVVLTTDSQGIESADVSKIGFWDDLDYICVHFSGGIAQISGTNTPTLQQTKDAFQVMFSTLNLEGYYQNLGKKTILITAYSSSEKCFNGDWFEEFEAQPDITESQANQEQLYSALFTSLSTHTWVAGILPWGYWWKDTSYNISTGDASFEKGPSIRGKPSEAIVASYLRAVNSSDIVYSTSPANISVTAEQGIAEISIPAGVFSQNVTLSLSTASVTDTVLEYSSGTVNLIGSGISITNSAGIQPSANVSISMSYRDQDVSTGTVKSSLVIARYNETSLKWDILSSSSLPSYNKVTSQTDHFSRFAVVSLVAAPAVSTSTVTVSTTTAGLIIVYPNPFKPAVNAVLNIEPVCAGETIKIFSITGDLVRKIDASSSVALWDGKNDSGNYVSSGVYIIHALSPSGTARKTKAAVIK